MSNVFHREAGSKIRLFARLAVCFQATGKAALQAIPPRERNRSRAGPAEGWAGLCPPQAAQLRQPAAGSRQRTGADPLTLLSANFPSGS